MKRVIFCVVLIALSYCLHAQELISEKSTPGKNQLIASASQAPIIICDQNDDWLVQKVCELLKEDISMVTGNSPNIEHLLKTSKQPIIVIGTVGGSALIKKLIQQKLINVDKIKNKWEAFQYTT